ncbi:MAG: phosphotransferase family protein [Alphaproteobacteria bacterium]
MNLDQSEFKKIIEFLSLENFYIDKDFIPKPIGDGQSNPTFLIRDERKKFKVLRTQPIGNLARGAHRVDREFSVLKALYNKGFECPEPFSLCNNPELIGRMFYVMGFEEGDINFNPFLPNENFENKQKIYKSLAEVLGRLHSYDIDQLGLPFKKNQGFMKRNLSLWYDQIFNDETKKDKEIEKVYKDILNKLPSESTLSLLHGDFKLDNTVISEDKKCKAVLDWELSSFGEPLVDISFQIINWLIPSGVLYGIGVDWKKNGLPSASDFLSWYENSYKKCVDIDSLRNACIFSLIKLYCILKGIENRFHQGNAISKDAEEKILSAPAIKEVLMNSYETNSKDIIVS